MFGWPDPNTGFDQSEHALYTSYFIIIVTGNFSSVLTMFQHKAGSIRSCDCQLSFVRSHPRLIWAGLNYDYAVADIIHGFPDFSPNGIEQNNWFSNDVRMETIIPQT